MNKLNKFLNLTKSKARMLVMINMAIFGKMTISELHSKSQPLSYKSIHTQVLYLEKEGLLKTHKLEKRQGKPVIVEIVNENLRIWLYVLMLAKQGCAEDE